MATLAEQSTQPKAAQHPEKTRNFAWLRRHIAKYRRATLLALLSGFFGGAATALQPYMIGAIVDDIRRGDPLEKIGADVLIMLGLAVVIVVAFFGQRHFSGEVAYRVDADIRRVLFTNMLTLEQRFYQRYPTGDLISRVHHDTEMVWRLLALGLNRFGSAFFTLVMAVILLSAVNLTLTIIVFIVLSISTYFQLRAGRVIASMFEDVQTQAGVLSAMVQDSVSGIQTIKSFGKEKGVTEAYHAQNVEYRRQWLFFKRRYEPIGMLPNMIAETTAGIVVLFGGILTLNGSITLGNFVQFLLYLGFISQVLLQLGTIYQRFQQTRGALGRVMPLLEAAEIADSPDAVPLPTPRGEIKFEKVSVKLEDKWLLRDISLHIPAGQVVALVGATGCGKTLMVNLLARVLDATEGRILVDGVDVRHLRLADLRRAIAYVPQTTFLFSQPLRTNVRMSRLELDDEGLMYAVNLSRLSNDLPQLPQGLETLVGERGVMLSGGQRQRVAIARAIVHDPAILILDDALSSVDTRTAAEILHALREVVKTRTSIIIAHRIATVKDADMIYVMDDGRIVESGTHTELLAKDGLYASMAAHEGLTRPSSGA